MCKATSNVILGCLVAGGISLSSVNGQELQLNPLCGDNMVLQRGIENVIWGNAGAGAAVVLRFCGKSYETKGNNEGRWRIVFTPPAPGGPYELEIKTDKEQVLLKNVVCGDVWICSGQSNMEWPLYDTENGRDAVATSAEPNIRLFQAAVVDSPVPMESVKGSWKVCGPDSVEFFSAVGYYFGRQLRQHDPAIPVGLINCSLGGTSAEAWTSVGRLDEYNQLAKNETRDLLNKFEKVTLELNAQSEKLIVEHQTAAMAAGYYRPDFNDKDWKTINLPTKLPEFGSGDGMAVFRRSIDIPSAWAGKDLVIELGAIDDFDVTFFNGEAVGKTGTEHLSAWNMLRRYSVPGNLVKSGSAVIAIQDFDHFNGGGFGGPADAMRLSCGNESIPLSGAWKYKLVFHTDAVHEAIPAMPFGMNASGLYNGMIAPLAPLAFKGAIWYQGEDNENRSMQYRQVLPQMIKSWRDLWNGREFPFLIVQLANFRQPPAAPVASLWAEMRESQLDVAKNTPNCALVTAIDIGNDLDIHPRNKKEVGRRLAQVVADAAKNGKWLPLGPTYLRHELQGNKIVVEFSGIKGKLIAKSDQVPWCWIAGADYRFVPAEGRLKGNTLIIFSPEVSEPVAVRYAWADNPAGIALYDDADMVPVLPFRTDNEPGLTGVGTKVSNDLKWFYAKK